MKMDIDDFEQEMSGKDEESVLKDIENQINNISSAQKNSEDDEPEDDLEEPDGVGDVDSDETSEETEYTFDKKKWEELGKQKGWIGGDEDLALKGLPNKQELTNLRFVEELNRLLKATDYDSVKDLEDDDPDKAQKIRTLAWETAVKESQKEFADRFNKALNSSKHVDTMKMIFETIQSRHKDIPLDLLTIEAFASVFNQINKKLDKKREKSNAHVITKSKKSASKTSLSREELQMCRNLNINPEDFIKFGGKLGGKR